MLGTPRRLTALGCAMALLEPGLGGAATHRRPARAEQHHPERLARPSRAAAREGATPGIAEEHVHVRRGDTLESLVAARGVAAAEARPWVAAAAVHDLRRRARPCARSVTARSPRRAGYPSSGAASASSTRARDRKSTRLN